MQSFEISKGYFSWPAPERILGDAAPAPSTDKLLSVVIAAGILAVIFGPMIGHAIYRRRAR